MTGLLVCYGGSCCDGGCYGGSCYDRRGLSEIKEWMIVKEPLEREEEEYGIRNDVLKFRSQSIILMNRVSKKFLLLLYFKDCMKGNPFLLSLQQSVTRSLTCFQVKQKASIHLFHSH